MASSRLVIVGAGPAGTRAAEVFIAAGHRPMLIDEAEGGGGQIYRRQPAAFTRTAAELYGSEAAKAQAVHRTLDALRPRMDYRPGTLAWNIAEGEVHILQGERTQALPFDALVIASGATDRIMPLPGWTMPGVYTLGAAQVALKSQACAIGRRVVLLGTGPLLYLVAYQYAKAGAALAGVLDTSPRRGRMAALGKLVARPGVLARGMLYVAALRRRGIRVWSGVKPVAFEGSQDGVSAVRFTDAAGRERSVACDAVGFGYHLRPETQLADLAECRFAFDPLTRQWLPETDAYGRSSVKGVYLAGDGARVLGADAAEISGALAAHAALADLGHPTTKSRAEKLLRAQARMERFRRGLAQAFPWPHRLAAGLPDEVLVCRCEAITAGELRRAARDLGAPELNRAKAFSRVGMGRCQGRYCGSAGAEILAAALGCPVEAVGRLRGQAPVKPLPVTTRVDDE